MFPVESDMEFFWLLLSPKHIKNILSCLLFGKFLVLHILKLENLKLKSNCLRKKINVRSKPKPPVSDAGITRVLQASEKSDEKSNKRDTSKPEETVPKEKRAEGGSKGKPVGVVKATPRTTPPDTQRSVNNIIKQDEVYIILCIVYIMY